MSLDATRWAWMQKGLKPADKLVLLAYADRASADDTAWPSAKSLVEDTGLNKNTIPTSLKRLREAGLIADTEERKGSTKQVIVYQLIGVPHRHEDVSQKTPQNRGVGEKQGSETHHKTGSKTPQNRTKDTTNVVTEPTRTVKEPTRERACMTCGHARSRLREEMPTDLTWHGTLRLGFSPEDASGPYLVCPSRYVVDWVRKHPEVLEAFEVGADAVVVGGIPDPKTMLIPIESNGAWRREA